VSGSRFSGFRATALTEKNAPDFGGIDVAARLQFPDRYLVPVLLDHLAKPFADLQGVTVRRRIDHYHAGHCSNILLVRCAW
jgi:hypothetical protein